MAHQDFNDDTKDAGEIGAGHHVTALYELVPPAERAEPARTVDRLEPARRARRSKRRSDRVVTVKLRYKKPERRHEPLDRAQGDRPGPRLRPRLRTT